MSQDNETDDARLEGWRNPQPQGPFTDNELKRLRQLLQDDDRATWLRKQIRVFTPWVVTVVAGIWALAEWLSKHLKWGGS